MNKILFVDNSVYEFFNFRGFIVDQLLKEGYLVALLVPEFSKEDFSSIDNNIEIYTFDMPRKISPIGDIKLLFKLYSLYKKIDPSLIIHYTIKPNIYGSIAAKLAKVDSISLIPGLGSTFHGNNIIKKTVSVLYKYALKHPKRVWVLNKDDYNTLVGCKILNPDKLYLLPSEGIDVDKFNSSVEYNKNKVFCFLFIGRIIREKGVEVLVKAASLLEKKTNIKFKVQFLGSIDGGFSSGSITQSQIDEWNKEKYLDFRGRVNDVRSYIEECDCIILPSFYGEGVPRSLMEGASMKKMIITTNNVGCREVVADGYNGFLCEPNDINSLFSAMKQTLFLTEEEIILLGENGRKKMINEFNKDLVIKEYFEVIKSIEKNA